MSQCYDKFTLDDIPDSFQMWQGLRGPYFTPHVAENGDLSWSNNGQLPNPETVNIKGPPGSPGPGVPAGGTTGQLLAKASDEDYAGQWIDPPDLDAGHVEYDPTEAYDEGSVGKELGTINSALTSLQSVTEIIDTASGAIASFPDGAGTPMRSLLATIEPQQDLHGYDSPWPAGGGKNKLLFLTANIKALNTVGTWNGNAYTLNGVTFTINEQNGVPVSVSVTGTATANTEFAIGDTSRVSGESYIVTGCPSGGSTSTYRQVVRVRQGATSLQTLSDIGSGVSIDATVQPDADRIRVGVWIYSEYAISGTLTFQPMVRLSTVTDATFAPYANECPITGWTGLSGKRLGTNLYNGAAGTVKDPQLTSATITDTTINGWSAHKVTVVGSTTSWGWRILYRNIVNYIRPATTYTITFLSSVNANLSVTFGNSAGAHPVAPQKTCTKTDLGGGVYKYNATFTTYDEANDAWNYSDQAFNPYASSVNSQAGEFVYSDLVVSIGDYVADSYEPYTSLPITCTWQTEAGTVYYGYIDVVSGELVATHGVDSINGSSTVLNGYFASNGNRVVGFRNDSIEQVTAGTNANMLASYAVSRSANNQYSIGDCSVSVSSNNGVYGIYVCIPGTTTNQEVVSFVTANPLQVVYPLAEPIVYQLTPQQILTLLGNNTVFVDTGSVRVTYQASIKGYIDKVLALAS